MNGHAYLEALDPPGRADRMWQCRLCLKKGHLDAFSAGPPCTGSLDLPPQTPDGSSTQDQQGG